MKKSELKAIIKECVLEEKQKLNEGYTELKNPESDVVAMLTSGYSTKSKLVGKEFENSAMAWLNKNGRNYSFNKGVRSKSWSLYYNDSSKKCCAVAHLSDQKNDKYPLLSPLPTYYIDYDGNIVLAQESSENKKLTVKGVTKTVYVYVPLRTVVANIYPGVEPANKTSKSDETKLKTRKTKVLTQVNYIVDLATKLKSEAKELEMMNVVKVMDNLIGDVKRNT